MSRLRQKSLSPDDIKKDGISPRMEYLNLSIPQDYCVKDMSLVKIGKAEVESATDDNNMLAIKLLKEQILDSFLKGIVICGCTQITSSTAVLIEALKHFGATVRWCSPLFSPVDDSVAAFLASSGVSVYAWENSDETEDSPWCREKCLDVPGNSPIILLEDGGHLSSFLLLNSHEKLHCVRGVIEDSLNGILRLAQFHHKCQLSFPVINTSEALIKKFCATLFISKESVLECIRQCNDVMISGSNFLICGYGHRGKICCATLKQHGGVVMVSEIDPICGYEAIMDGYELVNINDVISKVDVIITCTGGIEVINRSILERAKHGCIVMNLGKSHVEIDTKSLQAPDIIWERSDLISISHLVFKNSNKRITLLADGRMASQEFSICPMRLQSTFVCTMILGVMEIVTSKPGRYSPGIFMFPRILDEQVAQLFIKSSRGHLTTLTSEQAKLYGISPKGPFKTIHFHYTSPLVNSTSEDNS